MKTEKCPNCGRFLPKDWDKKDDPEDISSCEWCGENIARCVTCGKMNQFMVAARCCTPWPL